MRLDFTSSLYLGLHHDHRSLPAWSALTSGKPAVLAPSQPAAGLAARVAALAGCAAGLLFPSTLHLFWDLFVALGCQTGRFVMHCDAGLYPIARWGVERAASKGGVARTFHHHDPDALQHAVRRDARRPVVVTDGYCVACGQPAPLAEYAAIVRARRGYLVIDDTQAFGVLGIRSARTPLGTGGGGSLRHAGIQGAEILWTASLAKGFGVPVAALAGADVMIARIEHAAETRTHSSPPSSAVMAAMANALELNERDGELRRARLTQRVQALGNGVEELGLSMSGRAFPVQRMVAPRGDAAVTLHERLRAAGVWTVLTHSRCAGIRPALSWLLTSAHPASFVVAALERLRRALYGRADARRSVMRSGR